MVVWSLYFQISYASVSVCGMGAVRGIRGILIFFKLSNIFL